MSRTTTVARHRHPGRRGPDPAPMAYGGLGQLGASLPTMPMMPTPEQLFEGARRVIDGLEELSRMSRVGMSGRVGRCGRPGCDCAECAECACGRVGCGGCRQARCTADPCACTCCIGDADLVIRARVGELRVVPLTIENERRRERDVHLELSSFVTRGGRPSGIDGGVTPAEFTLGPCAQQAVILGVRISVPAAEGGPEPLPSDPGAMVALDRFPDVDECLVAYADLRVDGCDIRSLRIAVAVLPRDCETVPIGCGCGCC